jgi:hypothetical protein
MFARFANPHARHDTTRVVSRAEIDDSDDGDGEPAVDATAAARLDAVLQETLEVVPREAAARARKRRKTKHADRSTEILEENSTVGASTSRFKGE